MIEDAVESTENEDQNKEKSRPMRLKKWKMKNLYLFICIRIKSYVTVENLQNFENYK